MILTEGWLYRVSTSSSEVALDASCEVEGVGDEVGSGGKVEAPTGAVMTRRGTGAFGLLEASSGEAMMQDRSRRHAKARELRRECRRPEKRRAFYVFLTTIMNECIKQGASR